MMEMTIFTAFLVIQIAAKTLPVCFEKFAHLAIVQRVAKNHWIVWFFHPVVLHGVHEYAVHFVIYSGYVIGHH
jgi:hypothetical protein